MRLCDGHWHADSLLSRTQPWLTARLVLVVMVGSQVVWLYLYTCYTLYISHSAVHKPVSSKHYRKRFLTKKGDMEIRCSGKPDNSWCFVDIVLNIISISLFREGTPFLTPWSYRKRKWTYLTFEDRTEKSDLSLCSEIRSTLILVLMFIVYYIFVQGVGKTFVKKKD